MKKLDSQAERAHNAMQRRRAKKTAECPEITDTDRSELQHRAIAEFLKWQRDASEEQLQTMFGLLGDLQGPPENFAAVLRAYADDFDSLIQEE